LARSSPLNLLLAEDNLPDALLVREAIRMEGLPVEIHAATDGEQAVEFILRAENDPDAPCPDILLLDLNLPKLDGFEVVRRIRAGTRCKNLVVLIVTSSDSPSDRKKAAEFGLEYFRKPTSYQEFLKLGAVVKRCMEENRLL
jgi:DNA-binding response OmpR family regulator